MLASFSDTLAALAVAVADYERAWRERDRATMADALNLRDYAVANLRDYFPGVESRAEGIAAAMIATAALTRDSESARRHVADPAPLIREWMEDHRCV